MIHRTTKHSKAHHAVGRMFWLCLLVWGTSGGAVYGQVGMWRSFTNTNFIHDLNGNADTVWTVGTGGVVTFDCQSRTYLQTYTNVDGLSHIIVKAMARDQNNDIWFGTDGGGLSKCRFSKGTWRAYSVFDGVALNVNKILLTGNALWIGTKQGLSYFQWGWDWYEDDTTYVWKENYDSRNGLPSDAVISLASSDSMIWVGTENGISGARKKSNLKDPLNWRTFAVEDGLPSNEVLCVLLVESGMWIGTGGGTAFFDGTEWTSRGLTGDRVYDLQLIEGSLWAATSRGVFSLRDDQWVEKTGSDFESQDVRCLSQTDNGTIVAGTWGQGLAILEGTDWDRYPRGGPWSNNCEKVMLDSDGSLWCSSIDAPSAARISRYRVGQWTVFDAGDGLETGAHVLGMLEDTLHRKWFGTWGGGVFCLDDQSTFEKDDDEWTAFNAMNSGVQGIPEDPTYEVVTDMVEDDQGNIWFANFGVGVVVYSPSESQWETYTVSDNLADRLTRSLALEGEDVLWIGAEQNGASRLSTSGTPFQKTDDRWQTLNEEAGFTSTTVNDICVDGRNGVWLATNEGLFRYDDGLLSHLDEIQNTSALSLEMDALMNIWAGTSDSGVFVFNYQGALQQNLNAQNSGLISNEVRSISYQERTGEIWFATPLGLSRYASGVIQPDMTGDEVRSFPNPFLASGERHARFAVSGVSDGFVRIFTVAGECVAELSYDGIGWDGRNTAGELVGSGIYIVVVVDSDHRTRTGKIAVIR